MGSIRALKFRPGDGGKPEQVSLNVESSEALKSAMSVDQPAAYVISDKDLDAVRRCDDVIVDRGRRHSARQLWRYVVQAKRRPFGKIAVVDANYAEAGRFLNALTEAFAKISEKGASDSYIVGVDGALLEALMRPNRGKAAAGTTTSRRAKHEGDGKGSACAALFDGIEIPDALTKAFVGTSDACHEVRYRIMCAAQSDVPVMILGDTGTGKEIVAGSINKYSGRNPYVVVNCAAVPKDLFESILFGHEKGIFTDAKLPRVGLWETAGRGTLFLDEIGDLQPYHQAKILRALEDKKIRPVGSQREVDVPARIVTATNRDLYALVQAKQFREDLYYRLCWLTIRTPSLRHHKEDIPQLAEVFWPALAGKDAARLPGDVLRGLLAYDWPGNARELKAVLAALHVTFPGQRLTAAHLRAVFRDQGQGQVSPADASPTDEITLHRVQCLRQLRRADEAIRACQVALEPSRKKSRDDAETATRIHRVLHFRLQELEQLCQHPLLFHGEETFEAVIRLKGKLEDLHDQLRHGPGEAAHFNKELNVEFKATLSAIFKEVKRVMAGA